MKVDILKKELDSGVQAVLRATGRNLTLPLLSCILLKLKENSLLLRSTNLSIGCEYKISIKNGSQTEIIVPAQTLANTISALSSDKITLSFDKGNLRVETKEKKILIKGVSGEDFPTIPKVSGYQKEIEVNDLLQGFKSVFWSSATSDIKPEMASVYIYPNDNNLVFVATDSFRLAEKKVHCKNSSDFPPTLIPAKNIADIVRILENISGSVMVSVNKNQISFSNEKIYITSRVVDGVYPDYQQIIPKEGVTTATFLHKDFVDVLKMSHVFSDKFGHATFIVSVENKKCSLVTTSDLGENISTLNASLKGESVEVHLNIKYLTDVLSMFSSDSLSLSIVSNTKPIVLRGVGDHSFLYLVMPMNR